jgi:predicted MFS family arabinose efflux permease
MGLLNGIITAGAIIGAVAPSFLAEVLGYDSPPAMAIASLVVALIVALSVIRSRAYAR